MQHVFISDEKYTSEWSGGTLGEARREIHLEGSSREQTWQEGADLHQDVYFDHRRRRAQACRPGRKAVPWHKGLPHPPPGCWPTLPATGRAGKGCCSGSLHFPNKTLHKPLNEAGCPVEFHPSPISVHPFPQNVISPPHYWIPSRPCN